MLRHKAQATPTCFTQSGALVSPLTSLQIHTMLCSLATCEKEAGPACSRCRSVHYCSKEHQTQDWTIHKLLCRKLRCGQSHVPPLRLICLPGYLPLVSQCTTCTHLRRIIPSVPETKDMTLLHYTLPMDKLVWPLDHNYRILRHCFSPRRQRIS